MAKVAWSIPVLFVGAWMLTVGCDDDRGVVDDISVGGDSFGTAGNDQAGESGNHAGTGGTGGGDHAGGAGGTADAGGAGGITDAGGVNAGAGAENGGVGGQ